MRGKVVKALKRLDGFAVENPCLPGTPDLNYIDGWIELKWLPRWPVHERSKVAVPHFTPQQRLFLNERWRKGGAVFLLLQVRTDWLLFTGPAAAEHLGRVTRRELECVCCSAWRTQANMKRELGAALRRHAPPPDI